MIYVSPAEPAKVRRALIAECGDEPEVMMHYLPEKKGVDFLWRGVGKWWGVQRKELHDFLASLNDGRLATELGQMHTGITMPHLILEGRVQQTTTGALMTRGYGQPIHIETLWKRLFSLGYAGVFVTTSRDIANTCQLIRTLYEWSQNASHMTARTWPKPMNDWGTASSRDTQLALLQMMPTIGPRMAENMLDQLPRSPFSWNVTEQELLAVDGIGPKTVARLMRVFDRKPATGKRHSAP